MIGSNDFRDFNICKCGDFCRTRIRGYTEWDILFFVIIVYILAPLDMNIHWVKFVTESF